MAMMGVGRMERGREREGGRGRGREREEGRGKKGGGGREGEGGGREEGREEGERKGRGRERSSITFASCRLGHGWVRVCQQIVIVKKTRQTGNHETERFLGRRQEDVQES